VAVFGPGQVHAQKENQVGQAVHRRTADNGDGGITIIDGGGAQKGNQWPADHVADGNGGYAGNHPGAGALLKGAQVGVLGHGRPDEPEAGKALDKGFNWVFNTMHGISTISDGHKKEQIPCFVIPVKAGARSEALALSSSFNGFGCPRIRSGAGSQARHDEIGTFANSSFLKDE
jgi:hypothetical protein